MVSFDGAAMPGNRTALTLEETINDPEAPLPGQALARAEEMHGLRQAIAMLPEKERVVLTLYYYEELNLRQIAEILHVTESRISQIRTQALKRMRDRLTDRGDN
jgi:RNA polymerase sigma factor for flagellar operon FliA